MLGLALWFAGWVCAVKGFALLCGEPFGLLVAAAGLIFTSFLIS